MVQSKEHQITILGIHKDAVRKILLFRSCYDRALLLSVRLTFVESLISYVFSGRSEKEVRKLQTKLHQDWFDSYFEIIDEFEKSEKEKACWKKAQETYWNNDYDKVLPCFTAVSAVPFRVKKKCGSEEIPTPDELKEIVGKVFKSKRIREIGALLIDSLDQLTRHLGQDLLSEENFERDWKL